MTVLCLKLFQLLSIFSLLELHVLLFERNLSRLGTAGLRFYIFTKIMLFSKDWLGFYIFMKINVVFQTSDYFLFIILGYATTTVFWAGAKLSGITINNISHSLSNYAAINMSNDIHLMHLSILSFNIRIENFLKH